MAKGDYTKINWTNGSGQALNKTNLDKHEDKLYELDRAKPVVNDATYTTTTIEASETLTLTIYVGVVGIAGTVIVRRSTYGCVVNLFGNAAISAPDTVEDASTSIATASGAATILNFGASRALSNAGFDTAGAGIRLYSAYLEGQNLVLIFENISGSVKTIDCEVRYRVDY
jgi:hypothetical protein